MNRVGTCWSTIAAFLALATMLACQGVSAVSPGAESGAKLTVAPTMLSFDNVQIGTTQIQLDMPTSAAPVTPKITQASVKGTGFSIEKVSLPFPLPRRSTTLTVQNTGGLSAIISQVTIDGKGFDLQGISTPLTLAPGQSTSFNVTFTPLSAGNYRGGVAVSSNASNPTLTIPLTGSATGQSGRLSVSPNSINVGNVVVGTRKTLTGTLSADDASVTVSVVSMGGTNHSEFSIGGLSLPVTIAAGQSLNFTVKFRPQASGGAFASALFTSDASNSPTTATLAGTGSPAPVHSVSLSWTPSTSSNIAGYNIYRTIYTSACGPYSKINSGLNATTTYTDTSVAGGQTYCYVTTAVDSSDVESGYSNTAEAVIPRP
jgi:hypothetical protein